MLSWGSPKQNPIQRRKNKEEHIAKNVNKSWYSKKKTPLEVYTFYLGQGTAAVASE